MKQPIAKRNLLGVKVPLHHQSCQSEDVHGARTAVTQTVLEFFERLHKPLRPSRSQKSLMGKSTENLFDWWLKQGFPADFPINEPSDTSKELFLTISSHKSTIFSSRLTISSSPFNSNLSIKHPNS